MSPRVSWRFLVFAASVSGLALAPTAMHAADCSGPVISLVPDGRFSGPVPITTEADRQFGFYTVPGHTYSVEVIPEPDRFWTEVVVGPHEIPCPSTNIANLRRTTSMVPAVTNFRASFPATEEAVVVVRVAALTGFPSNSEVRASVSDTTMYSPSWTTNGTYNTYYSIFNTVPAGTSESNPRIFATLTLTRADGTTAGATTLEIPAGRTVATNTAALGIPRNFTGTAKLRHDGPPGALLIEAAIANFTITPPYVQPVKFLAVREGR